MSDSPATFAFTKLVVDDLEATTKFYEDVFALRSLNRIQAEIAGSSVDEIILGTDARMGPILLRWLDGRPVPRGEVILGVVTPDIHSVFDRAKGSGGRVHVLPEVSAEAGGVMVGFLEDPEGHLIEVVESP